MHENNVSKLMSGYKWLVSESDSSSWTEHGDAIQLLTALSRGSVPVLAFAKQVFIYSLLVRRSNIGSAFEEELLSWNMSPCSGYGYNDRDSEGKVWFEPSTPFSHARGIFNDAVPFCFSLNNSGHLGDVETIELNQSILHPLEALRIRGENRWCKLNELGESVEVASYTKSTDATVCAYDSNEIGLISTINDCFCVMLFELNKTTVSDGHYAWSEVRTESLIHEKDIGLHARVTTCYKGERPYLSSLRGFKIVEPPRPRSYYVQKLTDALPQEYEEFIIHDFKNRQVKKHPCDPKEMASYFVESSLPFETSPVFFKPDVLLQYRANPERYRIRQDYLSSGAWGLRYQINDDGLIVTILKDLSDLPHQVQMHWKAFNVEPRGPLSPGIIKTWYEGEWDLDYDPLSSFKEALHDLEKCVLSGEASPIWTAKPLPISRDIDFINYVLTDSPKEWEDQVQALEQIIVEGLNDSHIIRLAEASGCRDAEKQLKSLRLLEKVLLARDAKQDVVDAIIKPLIELRQLRKDIAHPGGRPPSGDLRQHYRELLARCDSAMRNLTDTAKGDILRILPQQPSIIN